MVKSTMSGRISIAPSQGEIELETVQKLVAKLENKDMRTLPQLPHRVILPGGQDALVKSDSGEHFYSLHREGNIWQCSCPGNAYHGHCKHVQGLVAYLSREEAHEKRAASLLLKDSAMTEAQRYQAEKRAMVARARRAPAMLDKSRMSTEAFRPCLAGE